MRLDHLNAAIVGQGFRLLGHGLQIQNIRLNMLQSRRDSMLSWIYKKSLLAHDAQGVFRLVKAL